MVALNFFFLLVSSCMRMAYIWRSSHFDGGGTGGDDDAARCVVSSLFFFSSKRIEPLTPFLEILMSL